ncbi:hypothetical protein VKT23_009541 [Stygiomarasmius scandens]|uniref:Uncharacterized protein n=1 Tax=Marasmiellus scandens TaxID=2682957 RepID=A0ABR1JE23_9AGAR
MGSVPGLGIQLGFNPNLVVGPLVLGNTLSSLLFGITTLQTYFYYGKFPNDPKKYKLAVRDSAKPEWSHEHD